MAKTSIEPSKSLGEMRCLSLTTRGGPAAAGMYKLKKINFPAGVPNPVGLTNGSSLNLGARSKKITPDSSSRPLTGYLKIIRLQTINVYNTQILLNKPQLFFMKHDTHQPYQKQLFSVNFPMKFQSAFPRARR